MTKPRMPLLTAISSLAGRPEAAISAASSPDSWARVAADASSTAGSRDAAGIPEQEAIGLGAGVEEAEDGAEELLHALLRGERHLRRLVHPGLELLEQLLGHGHEQLGRPSGK